MRSPSGRDRWNVTPAEGIRIQKELGSKVSRKWEGRRIGFVAGADVHFPSRDTAKAALVVMAYPSLEPVEEAVYLGRCPIPYIPGLLSFREIPPILGAWKKLKRLPDLILCDSHGIAHPRGLGMASHLGIHLDIPAIGCAKSHLFGSFEEPGQSRGERSPVMDGSGRTIGTVLRTRKDTRPVYVSIGHRIDLRTAVRVVLSCSPRYRIPEPLRAAHRLAGSNT
jgi:deoxyribonuclease V